MPGMTVSNDYYSDLIANATNSQSNNLTRTATDELDKNAFLHLLVTEMANQDPLNPMDDSDFIAQLAQFSVLEQMESLNSATMQSQGMALVGKYVIASWGDDAASYVSGVVQSVIYNKGETYLNVGGAIVNINNVKEIFDVSEAQGGPGNQDNTDSVAGAGGAENQDDTENKENTVDPAEPEDTENRD